MNTVYSRAALVLLILLLGIGAAFAQQGLDPNANSNFGSVNLEAGFQPDPYIVTLISGGDVDVSTLKLGAVCAGFVTTAPDFNIERAGQSNVLRIFFAGDGDTTLIVRDPASNFTCNDDFDAADPLVEFSNPMEGTYNIWVGSYTQGDFVPGYLMFSELPSSPAAVNSDLLHVVSGGSSSSTTTTTTTSGEIEGVEHFPGLSFQHVDGPVAYPQDPPAGGQHASQWLTCAVYTEPVPNENAVHSLEHGAVWITYRPDLDAAQVATLAEITRQSDHRLLSPYPGLDSPIVVTAWGYQLRLDNANDPRLMRFIEQYESGPTTPEPGAAC